MTKARFFITSRAEMDIVIPPQVKKAGINFALVSLSTILVAIVTEEGFFRGWLWGSLEHAGLPRTRILIWTSLAFSLWHWSAVMLKTGFEPLPSQVPVFMVNAAVVGAVWGCWGGSPVR